VPYVVPAQGDVRKYEDCERAVRETVARFGRLDILVNCAAGNFLATAEELSSNGFRTGASPDVTSTLVRKSNVKWGTITQGAGRQSTALVLSNGQYCVQVRCCEWIGCGLHHVQRSDKV